MVLEYFKEVKITLLMIISGVPLLPHIKVAQVYKCEIYISAIELVHHKKF